MALRKKKSLLDQASDYVDQVRPQVESAVASALDAVEEFYEKTARPALLDAKDKAGPALADAREKAAPYVAEARDRAAAALADAREKAGPALADARDKAAPLVAAGAAKAGEVAAQAKEAADARVAQLRGEEKKKGSKLKKLAIFAALAGAVGFVAKKLQGGGQSDNWQSSYVPTPAPAPRQRRRDDAGAAGPDEAISDAADEPQPVTTPDDPAEVVDLEAPLEDARRRRRSSAATMPGPSSRGHGGSRAQPLSSRGWPGSASASPVRTARCTSPDTTRCGPSWASRPTATGPSTPPGCRPRSRCRRRS